jgi:hypothetical protein
MREGISIEVSATDCERWPRWCRTATARKSDRVVELTLAEPPGEATHWTGREMAAASGISLRSVQRIWAAHGLQPHRVRRFKLSQGPPPSCMTWSGSISTRRPTAWCADFGASRPLIPE